MALLGKKKLQGKAKQREPLTDEQIVTLNEIEKDLLGTRLRVSWCDKKQKLGRWTDVADKRSA